MHEYRRFVESEMSKRQWNANQVAQHAGLQRQTIYDITQDKREVLPRPPASKTVDGLAHAFGISREKILAAVAQAMGLPVQIVRADVSAATNDELMSELSKRLKKAGEEHDPGSTSMNDVAQDDAGEVAEFRPRQLPAHLHAAYDTGDETMKQRLDRESEERDSGSQDLDDYS